MLTMVLLKLAWTWAIPWMTFLLPLALTIFSGSMVSSSESATEVPSFFSSFLRGFREPVAGLASLGASVPAVGAAGAAVGAAGAAGTAGAGAGAAASESFFFGAGAFDFLSPPE